jgi:hypothetical protein
MNNEPTQPCPFCDQMLRATARACPSCGQDLKDAPSERSDSLPPDTDVWLELFRQPAGAPPLNEPLIKPLRYRRALSEIVATGPRSIHEAAYGIAVMLGLHSMVHQEAFRVIVKDHGVAATWALAREIRQLPLRDRPRAFLERVRHTQAPPDAAQDS